MNPDSGREEWLCTPVVLHLSATPQPRRNLCSYVERRFVRIAVGFTRSGPPPPIGQTPSRPCTMIGPRLSPHTEIRDYV